MENYENMQFEQATRPIFNLGAGEELIGKLGEREFIKEVDDQFNPGKTRELHVINFLRSDGEKVAVWEDGGLKGALKLAKVQTGDILKIVGKGKQMVEGIGNVNQYEIYKAKH